MGRRFPRPAALPLRAALEGSAPATPLAGTQTVWPEVVGPHIAAVAEPVRERDGEVVVRCESAVWAQELQLLHDDLVRRLHERLGDSAPRRLRFDARGSLA